MVVFFQIWVNEKVGPALATKQPYLRIALLIPDGEGSRKCDLKISHPTQFSLAVRGQEEPGLSAGKK